MRVSSPVRAGRFADVPRGGVFRFSDGTLTMVAIKAWDEKAECCVVIAPGHPEVGRLPNIFDLASIEPLPIVLLPELYFVLPAHKSAYRFGEIEPTPGLVFLEGERCLLVVLEPDGAMRFVDLDSGQLIDRTSAQVACTQWSLVQPEAHLDLTETLFTFGEG
jgi:hypothetical protein